MPLLSDAQIIRLDRSKYSNKDKKFSAGTMEEILKLPIANRAAVLNYALTNQQLKQLDTHLDEYEKGIKPFLEIISKHFDVTKLDLTNQVLVTKGLSINLEKKNHLRILLYLLASNPEYQKEKVAYKDFLSDFKEELYAEGITETSQLRMAKNVMNSFINDFFPNEGCFVINPKYPPLKLV